MTSDLGPHMDAVMNQLKSELPSSIKPALGVAPANPAKPPYVVLYPDSGVMDSRRLSMENSFMQIRFFVHAIGAGAEQCLWVMDRTRDALLGQVLPVPNRTTHRITQTLGPQPLTRDLSSQPPVFLQVAEFRISSQLNGG